jgi:hypothetical protein
MVETAGNLVYFALSIIGTVQMAVRLGPKGMTREGSAPSPAAGNLRL